ncbi:MAG: branched-chain amino acid ABC transporter permease, partial [Promethearchaeota archaeon]
ALAFFCEWFIKVVIGRKFYLVPPLISGTINIGGYNFPRNDLLLIIGSLILITAVILYIKKSTIGKSIRAVSQDKEAAELMGINPKRVLLITFIIASLLAGAASVFYATGSAIFYYDGWLYLGYAFAVTIFGGMGSIPGSLLGAFVMGYTMAFTIAIPGIGPSIAGLVPFIVIVIMLLIRPKGLLGKKEVA